MKYQLFKFDKGQNVYINGHRAKIIDRIHFGYKDNQYIIRWYQPNGMVCAEIVPEELLV